MIQEPYPSDVLSRLSNKYQLPDIVRNQLRDVLILEGVKEAIQSNALDAEDLIRQVKEVDKTQFKVASSTTVKRIIEVYNTIKNTELFTSKKIKLSDLFYWLPFDPDYHVFVISAKAAKIITEKPNDLQDIQEVATKNPQLLKTWDSIREQIEQLNKMPLHPIGDRKELASKISAQLIPLTTSIATCRPLFVDYFEISQRLLQDVNARVEPIEHAATAYFKAFFEKQKKVISEMKFFNKKTGDQLGRIIRIKYKDPADSLDHEIDYFVKTHQHGSTSRGSSTKSVDPKELFVYKVLEYIGYGPKCHFFFNPLSSGGFFIATQDAGFTKQPSKQKKFEMFDDFKQDFEAKVNANHAFDIETKKGISVLDILARIFVLTDIITNYHNFGRVTLASNKTKWKIVDFRNADTTSYIIPGIFEGFKMGNGLFKYPEFITKVIRDKNETARMTIAATVINELDTGKPKTSHSGNKMPLPDAMNKAFVEMIAYIKQNADALKINLPETLGVLAELNDKEIILKLPSIPLEKLGDFGRYFMATKENYQNLVTGTRARHAELSQSATQSSTISTRP